VTRKLERKVVSRGSRSTTGISDCVRTRIKYG